MTEFLTYLFVYGFIVGIVAFLVIAALGAIGAAFSLTSYTIHPDNRNQ